MVVRTFVGLISCSLLIVTGVHAGDFDHDHKEWTATLARYQAANGMVKYARLKTDAEQNQEHPFNRYIRLIQQVPHSEFDQWNDAQKKAFLINAYNALTVKLILDHYPVKSIKRIGGLFTKPWSIKFFSLLGGEIQALDPIEHDWLRPKFKDYRIHAAVNCASYSCPPLRSSAFTAGKLDAQLDEQMRAWLSDLDRNNLRGKPLRISKIFDWYKKDLVDWGGGVLAVLGKYSPAPLAGQAVEYLDYNWDLNEAK